MVGPSNNEKNTILAPPLSAAGRGGWCKPVATERARLLPCRARIPGSRLGGGDAL